MNRRSARVFRNGTSLVVVIPADWARGEGIDEGDDVELHYDGEIRIVPSRKSGGLLRERRDAALRAD